MEITCLVSAITFFVANLVNMLVYVAKHQLLLDHWNRSLARSMDGKYLWQFWYHRDTLSGWEVFASFLLVGSWVLLTIPIVQVAYAASKAGKRMLWLHVSMACLAITGCTTEFIARLLNIGIWLASRWIAGTFELKEWMNAEEQDYTGFKVLEIVYQVAEGATTWIDMFDYFALFGIFFLNFWSFYSAKAEQRNPIVYGISLTLAVFCFCDGFFLVLRFVNWKLFTFISNAFAVVNRLVLIPTWLLIMARWLPGALRQVVEEQEASNAAHKDMDSALQAASYA